MQQSTLQYSKAIKIKCIKDRNCASAGDALRYLDSTNLVRSDPFILMSGDVVTNADIVGALAEVSMPCSDFFLWRIFNYSSFSLKSIFLVQHKARHKKDSSAIMTILFHKSGPASKASHRYVLHLPQYFPSSFQVIQNLHCLYFLLGKLTMIWW